MSTGTDHDVLLSRDRVGHWGRLTTSRKRPRPEHLTSFDVECPDVVVHPRGGKDESARRDHRPTDENRPPLVGSFHADQLRHDAERNFPTDFAAREINGNERSGAIERRCDRAPDEVGHEEQTGDPVASRSCCRFEGRAAAESDVPKAEGG